MKKPSYMKPGTRSIEGSGVDNSFPKLEPGLGELTPPGLVSYPAGAPTVAYQQGASTSAVASWPATSGSSVSTTPLAYHED